MTANLLEGETANEADMFLHRVPEARDTTQVLGHIPMIGVHGFL